MTEQIKPVINMPNGAPPIVLGEETTVNDTATITTNDEASKEVSKETTADKAPEQAPTKVDDSAVLVVERVPANWSIKPLGDGIEAANNLSGRKFTGTVAEFNTKFFR